MKKMWFACFSLVVCLYSGSSEARNRTSPIFFPPTCNTKLAVDEFKQRIGLEQPQPTSDGFAPWSEMMGFWLNSARDLVVHVRGYHQDKKAFLRVELISLCTGRLLAAGEADVTDIQADAVLAAQKKSATPRPLQMLLERLDGGKTLFLTTLTYAPKGKGNRRLALDVKVEEVETADGHLIRTDLFSARKF